MLKAGSSISRTTRAHEGSIRKRHVAQKNQESWFRTIDRVYPELVPVPKLLVPDIAGSNEVVFEQGLFHPHHNLYFITSSAWDLEVLGGLLSSKVALFFIWSYAVKMRGGYLRFQAQYLRRIRLPSSADIRLTASRHFQLLISSIPEPDGVSPAGVKPASTREARKEAMEGHEALGRAQLRL
jgi:hypothetical protein